MTISAKLFSILTTGFRKEFFLKFSNRYIMETGHAHWRTCFCRIKFVLASFVEGHLVTVSTKLFLILTTGFRGENLQKPTFVTTISHNHRRSCFMTDPISLTYFCRGSPKQYSCDVSSKLV